MRSQICRLLTWANIQLTCEEIDYLCHLINAWEICNETDIQNKLLELESGKTSELFGMDVERELFVSSIRALLDIGIPLHLPSQLEIEIVSSGFELDSIPKKFRPLVTGRNWLPEYIRSYDSSRFWLRGVDFELEGCTTVESRRKQQSRKEVFNVVSHSDERQLEINTIPDVLSEKEIYSHPKSRTDWNIKWKFEKHSPKTKLVVGLAYSPLRDSKSFLRDVSFLSPSARLIVSREEIFRPPRKWDTFFKYSLSSRFRSLIPIDGNARQKSQRKGRAKFVEANAFKNSLYRVEPEDITSGIHGDWFYIYRKADLKFMSLNTNDIWKAINDEFVLRTNSVLKELSESTKFLISSVSEIRKDPLYKNNIYNEYVLRARDLNQDEYVEDEDDDKATVSFRKAALNASKVFSRHKSKK